MIQFAREIAGEAGEILLKHYRRLKREDVSHKGRIDLVTVADRKSEEFLCKKIRGEYPDHGILSEETLDRRGEFPYLWVIDPLDGTTNYAHSYPIFSVSIALFHRGECRLGVVNDPIKKDLFWAEKGKGAFLHDEPLHTSSNSSLDDSLLATGFAYARRETSNNNVNNFCTLVLQVQGLRRSGCASLDLAYVAAGWLDGFWEMHLNPWDVAAGALMVKEAGGRVTDFSGGGDFLYGRNIVASNGVIHEPILQKLAPIEGPL